MHADILDSFNDYRLLKETDRQDRQKRKISRWVGGLMSDIFDVATNDKISSILQKNVHKLAANQDTLMPEESPSMLYVSRMEIREKR